MARDSRDNFGEYGGKPGLIQKAEDGHVELTVKERAMVGRIWGKGGSQGQEEAPINGGIDAVTGEVWEDASMRRKQIEREAMQAKLNGRGIEEV
jgi:hypothetical protein